MGTTSLLAGPLRWAWVAVLAVVLAVHLRHVRRTGGAHRLWHGGHAVMAAAMACMLLPGEVATTSAPLWFIGAGGAAGAVVVWALLSRWAGTRVGVPWVTLVVGLAATAYMGLMTAGFTAAPLTYALAAWLVGEGIGWFTGALRVRRDGSSGAPAAVVAGTAVDRVVLGLLAPAMAYLLVEMQQLPGMPMR